MKDIFLLISKIFGSFVSTKMLGKQTGVNTIFPFYHVVKDYQISYLRHVYPITSVRKFVKDLDYLLKRYKPISLSEMQYLQPLRNSRSLFHLTFDDGLKECFDVVAPILEKKGVPATFFVNPDFVDNQALFHRYKASYIIDRIRDVNATQRAALKTVLGRGELIYNLKHINYITKYKIEQCARILDIDWDDYLKTKKPYMTSEQLGQLINKGFSIGAHSMSHPELQLLTEQKQMQQILDSVNWIKENYPQEIYAFAFPFTDWGVKEATLRQIQKSLRGLLLFGTAGMKKDDFVIQRIPMEYSYYVGKDVIKMEYLYYLFKGFFRKNRRIRL